MPVAQNCLELAEIVGITVLLHNSAIVVIPKEYRNSIVTILYDKCYATGDVTILYN